MTSGSSSFSSIFLPAGRTSPARHEPRGDFASAVTRQRSSGRPGIGRRGWLSGAGLLLATAALPACARSLPMPPWLRLEVVDRDSGQVLAQHAAGTQRYVAGRPGARYGVQLRNLSAERVLLVLAVDGVNALTGETAAWDQAGYVLTAHQSVRIDGWRKSDREIAAFEFASQADAYASRTGRPLDVGVIGVALFRERVSVVSQPSVAEGPVPSRAPARREAEAGASESTSVPGEARQRRGESSSAPALGAAASDSASGAPMPAPPAAAPQEARLGTGHGAREVSVVTHTRFERASTAPWQVASLRYDSRANLVRQGVIREPLDPMPPQPRPFPGSRPGYVPDPPA